MTDNNYRMIQNDRRPFVSRLASGYKGVAILLLNTLVLYACLNLFLGLVIQIRHASRASGADVSDPVTSKWGADVLDQVYPDIDRDRRGQMLLECWNRPFVYGDFTHFKERPWNGKYVNVTDDGYRKSVDQGPWPPSSENLNVFVFGGSTTFGYGQPDELTLPSFLQQALAAHTKRKVSVYNFGVGWYFSTQERICFEKLLMQGHVPQIAFFIDGINDSSQMNNRPAFSREMAGAFDTVVGFDLSQSPATASATYLQRLVEVGFVRLPIGRLVEYLKSHLPVFNRLQELAGGGQVNEAESESLRQACETYFMNKLLIEQACQALGVLPVFVWQPAPGYKYELKHDLFAGQNKFERQGEFYRTMLEQLEQRPPDPRFIWCADMQENAAECLYCDHLHYTSAFMKTIADRIIRICSERKLLGEYLPSKSELN